jgi:hypothetical protein
MTHQLSSKWQATGSSDKWLDAPLLPVAAHHLSMKILMHITHAPTCQ